MHSTYLNYNYTKSEMKYVVIELLTWKWAYMLEGVPSNPQICTFAYNIKIWIKTS